MSTHLWPSHWSPPTSDIQVISGLPTDLLPPLPFKSSLASPLDILRPQAFKSSLAFPKVSSQHCHSGHLWPSHWSPPTSAIQVIPGLSTGGSPPLPFKSSLVPSHWSPSTSAMEVISSLSTGLLPPLPFKTSPTFPLVSSHLCQCQVISGHPTGILRPVPFKSSLAFPVVSSHLCHSSHLWPLHWSPPTSAKFKSEIAFRLVSYHLYNSCHLWPSHWSPPTSAKQDHKTGLPTGLLPPLPFKSSLALPTCLLRPLPKKSSLAFPLVSSDLCHSSHVWPKPMVFSRPLPFKTSQNQSHWSPPTSAIQVISGLSTGLLPPLKQSKSSLAFTLVSSHL